MSSRVPVNSPLSLSASLSAEGSALATPLTVRCRRTAQCAYSDLCSIHATRDLRNFVENTDLGSEDGIDSIRIQARLLWVTSDTVRGRRFLRLYLGEHQAPEPLQQQQQEYQAYQAEDPFHANKFLITVSLLEVDENDPRLPTPGAIVSFTPLKLHLYRDCCQADAKQAIKNVDAP